MTTLLRKDALQILNKVPEVTLYFWVIKILATTVGETGADFLSVKLGFGLNDTSLVMGSLLAAVLVVHLRATQYIPWLYWVTVVLMSVVGTLITDNLTDKLGVSLFVSSAAFSAALAATFAAWYASERTLSVHTIVTTRQELFYWAAILFTFALGTAGGDLMAEKLQLRYGPSALIFASAIAVIAAAFYVLKANAILAFWAAYVLTRPLGASIGDLLSQQRADGGLGLGTMDTSALFPAIITSLIVFMTLRANGHASPPRTAVE